MRITFKGDVKEEIFKKACYLSILIYGEINFRGVNYGRVLAFGSTTVKVKGQKGGSQELGASYSSRCAYVCLSYQMLNYEFIHSKEEDY